MGTDFAAVAGLLGHPARSAMVDALMSGEALTAGQLAEAAGVGRSTASGHLARLVAGGLVAVAARGRHRVHRLGGPDVAEALEALARICPPTPVRSLRHAGDRDALGHARTCYDHLAGAVGVALTDALEGRGWIGPAAGGYALSPAGEAGLVGAGVDVAGARAARRAFARPCLDWTERRPHLAGALGAAVAARALAAGWVRRRAGRGVAVTPAGRDVLAGVFGVPAAVLDDGTVRHPPRAARA
ncbi:MAG TPA: helix-turn-helix transcriptional regulator [Acidimicrobiales bacterium]